MTNLAMQQKLQSGEALDVLQEGHEISDGLYLLRRFVDGRDYCDPKREWWIWSIGRNVFDGRIMASVDTRFYQDPNWDCLFLR